MAPTNKSSVDVVDKNKCITCAKKLSRSSKVTTCSVCEISVHIECANYEGDASSYKCENCKINSSDASIETVIDKQNGSENNDILRYAFPEVLCEKLTSKYPEAYASFKIFCEQIDKVLEAHFEPSVSIILCGDFNVDPVRDENNYRVLTNILDTYGLKKRSYYENRIKFSKNITKSAWSVIQEIRNKRPEKIGPARIKDNKMLIEDREIIANRFNQHFVELPKNILGKIPQIQYRDSIRRNSNTMFLFPFDENEFLLLMTNKLKHKNSCGSDEIPSFLVKRCINEICAPLVYIVNLSFFEAIFPEKLKINKVVPILKKGDEELMDNYRPIALSSVLSKIFEYCYADRLVRFLDTYNILSKNQFGFRAKHSTSDAIFAFMEKIVSHIESGECPAGIFCDLSSAFDCVSHEILKVKAEKYGIRGKSLEWMTSYLTNRKQYVSLKSTLENGCNANINSNILTNGIGVPQGSILGPILFTIYINDLSEELNCDLCLYADDTTAITSGRNREVVKSKLHDNFNDLHEWFSRNYFFMNTTKTKYIIFHNYNNANYDIDVFLNGVQFERATQFNFLGICIDEHLNWKGHCDALNSKLNSACYLIRSLRSVVSAEQLISVYHAYVSSKLRYGACFWGTTSAAEQIFRAQKKAVRALSGISQRTSCTNLFKTFKILTLPSIVIMELAILVYKNKNLYLRNQDFHGYCTRNREMFAIPLFKYRIGRHSPAYLGIKVFNKLSNDIRCSRNINIFKAKLKTYLINECYYSIDDFLFK
nr:unnamed protein product [Callosobruchus analis]